MKKLISLISALTMLAAVPMSASAEDAESGSDYLDHIVETILTDLSLYDFNADGTTNFVDVLLVMDIYADSQVQNIRINDDRTYSLTECCDDPFALGKYTEEELIRTLATGNISNPEWRVNQEKGCVTDKVDVVDATFLLMALSEYYDDGDINADGAVDSLDASSVLSRYAAFQTGEYPEMSPESLGIQCLGDFNADGTINALDASEILAGYAAAQTE